ncbi:MAG TPA: hypothetical protein VJL38_00610 [Patescibacteria group bacterium]|nr:hypothetical protein [Patescibacteria group bacterium]
MKNEKFIGVMTILGIGTGFVITVKWIAMLLIVAAAIYTSERRACLAFLAATSIVAWLKLLYFH